MAVIHNAHIVSEFSSGGVFSIAAGTSWPAGPGGGVGGSISSSVVQMASVGWAGAGGCAGGGVTSSSGWLERSSSTVSRCWAPGGIGGGAVVLASGW